MIYISCYSRKGYSWESSDKLTHTVPCYSRLLLAIPYNISCAIPWTAIPHNFTLFQVIPWIVLSHAIGTSPGLSPGGRAARHQSADALAWARIAPPYQYHLGCAIPLQYRFCIARYLGSASGPWSLRCVLLALREGCVIFMSRYVPGISSWIPGHSMLQYATPLVVLF